MEIEERLRQWRHPEELLSFNSAKYARWRETIPFTDRQLATACQKAARTCTLEAAKTHYHTLTARFLFRKQVLSSQLLRALEPFLHSDCTIESLT